MIVTRGWQTGAGVMASELGLRMRDLGAKYALYTEVGRDGVMKGTAAELTGALAQLTGLHVIASGGIGSLDDIKEVALYQRFGVCGVVIGKALYEGRFQLEEALKFQT
jgi:phosphoribosylformimino-5-aminoimidazole carboxamide ribotide isomerase